jgi:hypothetical protein
MKWFLDFKPSLPPFSISALSPFYLAGSCFAHEWASQLSALHWPSKYHPLHISYQPRVLLEQLEFAKGIRELNSEHWVHLERQWRHLDFHSVFSHSDQTQMRKQIEKARRAARTYLKASEYFILTLGTARSFRYKKTQRLIANCHKLPQSNFEGAMESVEEVMHQVMKIQNLLESLPKFKQAIWTVSPVRHARSWLVENQRSKSRLLLAVENVVGQSSRAHYFPAYEWMIDVLRDYRFYNRDKVHPSREAFEYILQQFTEMYFNQESKDLFGRLDQYHTLQSHRPSDAHHQAHEKQVVIMKKNLLADFPGLQLD